MSRFNVGDWVTINLFAHPEYAHKKGKIFYIRNDDPHLYGISFNSLGLYWIEEKWLELVEPVKLSKEVNVDRDGFLKCGRNVISGVRSGKSETHANSMFDKESRDRIMKLMNNNDSLDAYMYGIDKMAFVGKAKPLALTPSKVFFNDKKKATTIMFGETATVVKCGKGDKYDRRIGFLEAYFQATCNMSKNKALKYLNEIVKDKEVKEETKVEEKPNETKE